MPPPSLNGVPKTVHQTHPNFAEIRDLLMSDEFETDEITELMDVRASIAHRSHGSIVIEGDQVLYRGQLMHGLLSERLVEALEAGGQYFDRLIAFADNYYANPSYRAREQLWPFLHINLSADNLAEVDELASTGLSVVTILSSDYGRRLQETLAAYRTRRRALPSHTAGNLRIAICPATYLNVTCVECQVCSRLRPNGTVMGFPAHANRSASVDAVFMAGESGPGASA